MFRFLLIFAALAQIGQCSCPNGLELVRDGECRGSVANMTLTVDVAISTIVEKCNEIQGQPIIIHDDEHQNYWVARTDPNDRPLLPLGLICNSKSNKWEWADGSPVDYKPKLYDPVLDSTCILGIAFHFHTDGGWWTWSITAQFLVDVSCTKKIHPPINDDDCDYFENDSEDGVCYQVGATAENWKDAQMICKKLGANLASIHNPQENSFVRRLAVSRGAVTGLYLGATLSGKGGNYGWIDGSDWDYNNFAPGFPKAGFGDCIGMDTASTSGQWMNIECSETLPVACIREPRNIEPTCSSDTFIEGEIATSPDFPFNASTPCDYYLMVDEDKRVEVEIVILEANSCCDRLIIYDGYFGNVLANLTGEMSNVTYTTTTSHVMKVSWQPNGGVDVMGVAMTFRGV